jgi:hypothetical protein
LGNTCLTTDDGIKRKLAVNRFDAVQLSVNFASAEEAI